MKYKKQMSVGFLSLLLIFILPTLVQAVTFNANYSVNPSDSSSPQFVIQALKYEPYPVSAGDWFDIWIKVQNIGADDAKNVEFTLMPSYPFEATDSLVRDFGIVNGNWAAHSSQSVLGDSTPQTNQVLMKFRVKVADNAPVGESMLELKGTTNKGSGNSVTYDIPVIVGKTKTDFDVVLQEATSAGTSLSIANTGENPATAVTVSIPKQSGVISAGPSSTIIGNLAGGDFTTVSFQATPSARATQLTVNIAYTDVAGVRNLVEKNLSIETNTLGGLNSSARGGYRNASANSTASTKNAQSWILYSVLGAAVGAGAVLFLNRKKSK